MILIIIIVNYDLTLILKGNPDVVWKVANRARPILGKSWTASLYGGLPKKSFPVKLATNDGVHFDHPHLNLKASFNNIFLWIPIFDLV